MGKDPDQIRADIEATRAGLGHDVDALADKVSPAAIAQRRADAVKSGFAGVKTSVMGAGSQVGDRLSGTGGALGDAASTVPGNTKSKASGNPLAAGLIAFGAGWLLSSLLPGTQAEAKAAAAVKDNAGMLTEPLMDAVHDAQDTLAPKAQEALGAVKDAGASAAQEVSGAASEGAATVKDQASDAAGQVKETATP